MGMKWWRLHLEDGLRREAIAVEYRRWELGGWKRENGTRMQQNIPIPNCRSASTAAHSSDVIKTEQCVVCSISSKELVQQHCTFLSTGKIEIGMRKSKFSTSIDNQAEQ